VVETYEIEVTHTIDAGHRVVNHLAADGSPGKCSRIHGHTYAFTVTLLGPSLDDIGFVADFGRVKGILDEWDHRLLLWDYDPMVVAGPFSGGRLERYDDDLSGVVRLPFNPTAENMARHLAGRLVGLDGVMVARVAVSETAKTKASWTANRLDLVPYMTPDEAAAHLELPDPPRADT
jgi:6-pyruvoyltetrahydropterin/6-carboxytetrahydropterin synthase